MTTTRKTEFSNVAKCEWCDINLGYHNLSCPQSEYAIMICEPCYTELKDTMREIDEEEKMISMNNNDKSSSKKE